MLRMNTNMSPDFSSLASRTGLLLDVVSSTLDYQNVPILINLNAPTFLDFLSWFSDVENINTRYNGSLRLDRDQSVFTFQSNSFFPMDNRGFVNDTDLKDCSGESHNFGYDCL